MSNIISKPRHGDQLIDSDGKATKVFQLYLDDLVQRINDTNFTVATLPDAAKNEGRVVYVSDEVGGATLAFSDNTNWRRAQDRAVVS